MLFGGGKAARDLAFATFVDEASPRLLRVAIGLTGSGEAARELLQASLVKTYVAWPRIRHEDAYAYVRRIMANQKVDAWRATRKEVVTDDLPDTVTTPSTGVEDHDTLLRLLGALPQRQRTVVVLRYYDDLSETDVADTLGISVGAVKSAASRGLAALRVAHSSLDTTEAGAR